MPQLTAAEIVARTEGAIERANATIDAAIAAANDPKSTPTTFDALFGALDDAAREVVWASGYGASQAGMTSDDEIRAACFAALELIEKWRASLPLRTDLAEAVERFVAATDLATLAEDERAFVERWRTDIRLAGATLPPEDRAEVARLTERLVELASTFQGNLALAPHIEVAREELAGLPAAIVDALGPGSDPGTIDLPVNNANYLAVMTRGRNRDLRRRVYLAWVRKGYPENLAVFEEVLQARRTIAQLLGYPSWQALRADNLAAPSADWMNAFITGTAARLAPLVRRDYDAMVDILRAEPGAPANLELEDWDWRYADQLQRTAIGCGPNDVAPYLELEAVLQGLATLTEEVFGLRLHSHPERHGWHPDVRGFDVVDAASGRVLAHLFMDPFARDGKTPGAWADILLPGSGGADRGTGAPPTLVFVMNAPAPSDGPSLLSSESVKTLFHEYGHVMNLASSSGRFTLHRDSWLAFDFIEGPSMFLGSWGLEPEVMGRFARHHLTGEPIPAWLMDGLVRTASLNDAVELQRQLWLARFDALVHGPTNPAIEDAVRQAWDEIRDLPWPDGSSMPSSLTHIVNGAYHGALYGYSWSDLVRVDLLNAFKTDGLLSPAVGARYRRTILDVGWDGDPVAAVHAFLGRPWSADAFIEMVSA